jgi:GNAT superfamily N-acetyltransferase
VQRATQVEVEDFWCDVFGLELEELWQDVTVRPHSRLRDYDGWYVAWRGEGVHISAPLSAPASDAASLGNESPVDLRRAAFWQAFALQRSMRVVGPAVHHYLDTDPGVPEGVEQVDPVRLTLLRDKVSVEDWEDCGIPEALADGGEALAAWGDPGDPGEMDKPWVPALLGGAVLTETAGANRDIGLLVAAEARGRGVGSRLGQAAASYAVQWHGWARWTARTANEPSLRTARRLGFQPYATALAVKP